MSDFKLPSLGADMDAGTLERWLVAPGDTVKRGQVVAVVETSKAAVDVEIWQDGQIEELKVQPGQKVPVGTVLATLRTTVPTRDQTPKQTPELIPEPTPEPILKTPTRSSDKSTPDRPQPISSKAQPAQTTQAAEQTVPAVPAPTQPVPASASRVRISPAARKRALEIGLDWSRLKGSGVQSSVVLADLEHISQAKQVSAASPSGVLAGRQQAMRRAIAAAMSRSKREIPHYYLSESIPMTLALAWLQQHNTGVAITERLLPAVLQLKAVALALQQVPQLNGHYVDGEFHSVDAVHAGMAIALRGGGLVAPALHDVQSKPLTVLMREMTDLVKRARAGSLRSSEMSDPTVTVTNLGDQGVESVFGVIYPPQVALVGFGAISARPVVEAELVCARPVVTASLAADHRVTDGHQGALFLTALRELLQSPEQLEMP